MTTGCVSSALLGCSNPNGNDRRRVKFTQYQQTNCRCSSRRRGNGWRN
ncbi:hypothetical protein O9992_13515 [Vibrio lentus]|nr:hypothetical protein [Vibrio lentus]